MCHKSCGQFACPTQGETNRIDKSVMKHTKQTFVRMLALGCVSLAIAGCETAGTVGQVAEKTRLTNSYAKNNIASISEVIKSNPNDANALNLRGTAYGGIGDYKRALDDFNAAIAIAPDYHQAYANRALIHVQMKQFDLAMRDYDKAIQLAPDYAVAYIGRANLHRAMNNIPLAMADFNRALELRPDDPIAYYNRGLLHQALNDHQSAVNDFTLALGLRPDEADPSFARGVSLLALQEFKKAYDDFQLVTRIRSNDGEAWSLRGRAAEGHGDLKEASRSYRRALQISPSNKLAREGLARVGSSGDAA